MVKIKKEVLLEPTDLNFDGEMKIRNAVAECIRSDKEVMADFRKKATDEWINESLEFRKNHSIDEMIEEEVFKLVSNNWFKFRQYITVEMEIPNE